MLCDNCQGELTVKAGQQYHYTMSGLDNVFLENLEVEQCPSCGQVTPYIPRMPQLHKMIAARLVLKPTPLLGKEMRFLRKERRQKAKDWAALLKITPETISQWENGGKYPSPSMDQFIRVLYCRLFEEQENQMFTGLVLRDITKQETVHEQDIRIDVLPLLNQIALDKLSLVS